MNKKHLVWAFAATMGLSATTALTSCSDDNTPTQEEPTPTPTPNPDEEGEEEETSNTAYVIAAKVGDASYLLTAQSLDEGTISARNNGTEVIGATYWVFKDMTHVFALVYNNGGNGTGASYYLDANGKAREKYSYTYNRITTYGTWGDNVITVSTGNSKVTDADGNIAQAFLFNYLNANDGSQEEGSLMAESYLGNGEKVTMAGIEEANGKVYTSIIPMGMSKYGIKQWPSLVSDQELIAQKDGGSNSSAYTAGMIPSTQYPDSAFVAIYSGSNFDETPVIARTGKIGFACGRMRSQYYQTIWAADNGDLYVFSPGYGRTTASSAELKQVTGQLPSGVMRIKAGETDFDPNYYVNLEEIGDRKPMYRCWHIEGNYFLLQMYKDGVEGLMQGRNADVSELAVFNGEDQSIVTVTGLPADLAGFGGEPFNDNGAAYIAVTTTGGSYPAFYKIDPATGVATKGLTVEADALQTAGKLEMQK